MKSIDINKKQKEMLLEMCKVLFPEYPNLEVRDSMEDFCMEQDNCFIELQESGSNSRKDTIIHWFEFCMTWLSHKIIFNPKEKLRLCEYKQSILTRNIMGIFYGEKIAKHPVDYLYSEFLKLSK